VGVLVLGSLWWLIGVVVIALGAQRATAQGLPGSGPRGVVVGMAALGAASQAAVLVLATCYACCKVCCVVRKQGRKLRGGREKRAREPRGPPAGLPTGLVAAPPEGPGGGGGGAALPAAVRMPAHPLGPNAV
jgi:hypothetical protein